MNRPQKPLLDTTGTRVRFTSPSVSGSTSARRAYTRTDRAAWASNMLDPVQRILPPHTRPPRDTVMPNAALHAEFFIPLSTTPNAPPDAANFGGTM